LKIYLSAQQYPLFPQFV